MKLLFDQNLSRRLVAALAAEFPESQHVTHVGLETATDEAIWDYAGEHGFVIMSKDSDFRQLAFLFGPPPKAVWLRLGNASTADVLTAVRTHLEVVRAFADSADESLLVLPAADDL